MKTAAYFITAILLASACTQPEPKPSRQQSGPVSAPEIVVPETAVPHEPDTSDQDLYAFMQIVIAEQKLDLSYGLQLEAEPDCGVSEKDEVFLKTLLIKPKKKEEPATFINDSGKLELNTNAMIITFDPTCLTRKEISEMLAQKKRYTGFQWNSERLGFRNPENRKNWYAFSVPLRTKTKAILMIRNLCPGLCGTGETLLFEKKGRRWTSWNVGGIWMH